METLSPSVVLRGGREQSRVQRRRFRRLQAGYAGGGEGSQG